MLWFAVGPGSCGEGPRGPGKAHGGPWGAPPGASGAPGAGAKKHKNPLFVQGPLKRPRHPPMRPIRQERELRRAADDAERRAVGANESLTICRLPD